MAGARLQKSTWRLVRRQHGVVARRQLLELGYKPNDVAHRLATGRLHPVYRGVYAVGRPDLPLEGQWLAAVLACGPRAMLSHLSAAALWGMRRWRGGAFSVTVPPQRPRRVPGIAVHRRTATPVHHLAIPVTDPVRTLIDSACLLHARQIETAINEGDKFGVLNLDELRAAVRPGSMMRGAAAVRALLDRHTFTLTDSELEQRFVPLARAAGLPLPQTRCPLNGFRVDFFWPELGLVVETDGLRYHRTPAEQARDRLRDQTHTAAGLTPLRFTHWQVKFDAKHVRSTLAAVAARLSEAPHRL